MDHADLPEIRLHLYHRSLLTSEIPLGMVTLNLMSVDSTGKEFLDIWMSLEKFGRMKDVSGQIRVRLQFNRPRTGEEFEGERGSEDEESTRLSANYGFSNAHDEAFDDIPPN